MTGSHSAGHLRTKNDLPEITPTGRLLIIAK